MSRILIADDHSESVERLSRELEAEGYEVSVAASGDEALTEAIRAVPDMVILGPTLPVFDGYETCAMLRADPDIPVEMPIVLLADHDADRRKMERAGFSGTLPRECTATDLREYLSQRLGY